MVLLFSVNIFLNEGEDRPNNLIIVDDSQLLNSAQHNSENERSGRDRKALLTIFLIFPYLYLEIFFLWCTVRLAALISYILHQQFI